MVELGREVPLEAEVHFHVHLGFADVPQAHEGFAVRDA
jgi:hypothetical protein